MRYPRVGDWVRYLVEEEETYVGRIVDRTRDWYGMRFKVFGESDPRGLRFVSIHEIIKIGLTPLEVLASCGE